MDVGEWLRSLGLEQHETAFRENAVDAETLPTLTAQELITGCGKSLQRTRAAQFYCSTTA
jgi:SAM domain (Sterile alpha motif)